jgi:hypothetical protein
LGQMRTLAHPAMQRERREAVKELPLAQCGFSMLRRLPRPHEFSAAPGRPKYNENRDRALEKPGHMGQKRLLINVLREIWRAAEQRNLRRRSTKTARPAGSENNGTKTHA